MATDQMLALRVAEASLLRAEANVERLNAKYRREGEDGFENADMDQAIASLHEAKAEMLLAQADFVMHSAARTKWETLHQWLMEQDTTHSDNNEVYIRDVLHIMTTGKVPS